MASILKLDTLQTPSGTGVITSQNTIVSPGNVIQVVTLQQGTPIATTSQMNYSTTTPSYSQGAEICSVSFIPKVATSKILFTFNTYGDVSTAMNEIFAFFEGTVCINAIAPRFTYTGESGFATLMKFTAPASTTNVRTYSVRFGPQNPGTANVNRYPAFTGMPQTSLVIMEIAQ